MDDFFTKKLSDIAKNSPSLRQVIINSMDKTPEPEGYILPHKSLLAHKLFDPYREELTNAINTMTVEEFITMLEEVKESLKADKEKGAKLGQLDKLLLDIDVRNIAEYALITWILHAPQEEEEEKV